jgi:hypothetical protein
LLDIFENQEGDEYGWNAVKEGRMEGCELL